MLTRLRTYVKQQESGQVLIQAAVMILVLLGFAALAVDVGNVYAERRRMQNAADAGALAGARELCLVNDPNAAIQKAKDYMIANGVPAASIGANDVKVTGNIIDTTARKTAKPFLTGVLGFNSFPINAGASAACGAASTACGLWPIAFSQSIWQTLYDNGKGCGKEFIIWNDDENEAPVCTVNGQTYTNLCNCYQCDLNKDNQDDFAVVMGAGRSWLDFPAPAPGSVFTDPYSDDKGCGERELEDHIRHDEGAQIGLNQCIPGSTGVKSAVKDAINARVGDHVSVALYSGTCATSDKCNGQAYTIASFGCVDVVGWFQTFQLEPKVAGYKKLKGKVIRVKMNCSGDCTTACGGTDGTPAQPWQLKTVSLTK